MVYFLEEFKIWLAYQCGDFSYVLFDTPKNNLNGSNI